MDTHPKKGYKLEIPIVEVMFQKPKSFRKVYETKLEFSGVTHQKAL